MFNDYDVTGPCRVVFQKDISDKMAIGDVTVQSTQHTSIPFGSVRRDRTQENSFWL